MERSLFSFIWKYSRREQIGLLVFTLMTFPFLYATLELPKRIINDAIGSETEMVEVLGVEVSQVQFLMALCFGYLASVLVNGLLKMRLNTMKGVLAERLLRRFRYKLLSRMMRFPPSYFQNTSQGELVSMVTSEAEPMGGLMGDAIAQPVFQAGQMLIIVMFLFLQSVWFGLAGIALIPLQAWLIPLLQRQINLLNKERIQEVRQLASEIGETAAGITELRTNGGWRFRLAQFTDRLGLLFDVRFRIYQKKFFMKFLNNFITQLTPFFFYAVGGYLAIKGEITVGALVAALAAYKDLSSPWKELLAYYNQTQDMSLRWEIVVERFAPSQMIEQELFEEEPEEIPHLQGDIELTNLALRNPSGEVILNDINLHIPSGSQVALKVGRQAERTALSEILTREVYPTRGRVEVAGHDLSKMHQSVVAARIGYAHAKPYLFQGTVGDNLLMPLRTSPKFLEWNGKRKISRALIEAQRAGNSLDQTSADWLDPAIAELNTKDDVNRLWYQITSALGSADANFRRMLNSQMDQGAHPDLAAKIVALRQEVSATLLDKGLDRAVYRFDPERFNPTVPLGGNLFFAAPRYDITPQGLAAEKSFLAMVIDQGLAAQGIAISQTVVETLHETFGLDGRDHPLFTALGIDEALYEQLVDISARRRKKGDEALSEEEFSLLLTVPFAFTAEQIGAAFPEAFKQEILRLRKEKGHILREQASDMFVPIAPENYLPRLTLLENLIYGRVGAMAGHQASLVEDAVAEVLEKHDLKQLVSVNLMDLPTTIGGANLPADFQQRAVLSRAVIKRPDVLVLNQALAGHSPDEQSRIRGQLRELLPKATQIYINDHFAHPEDFDLHIEIKEGRVGGIEQTDEVFGADSTPDDLRRKLRFISQNELFSGLDARNRRLLAFAAQWYTAEDGQSIFKAGDPADAAYLCLAGKAELGISQDDGSWVSITDVEPGRLIGDLSILLDEPRQLDLKSVGEVRFLRIGAEQFRSVIGSDNGAMLSIMRTVAGYLAGAAELMIAAGLEPPRGMGPPRPPLSSQEDDT